MRELIFELYKLPEGIQPVINVSYEEVRKCGYIGTDKARYSKWYNWKFDFSANETKKNIQVVAREDYVFLPNNLEFTSAYNHSFSIKAYIDEDVEESRLIDIAEMKSPLAKEFGCHEFFTLFCIKEVTNLEAVDNWLDIELYTCVEDEDMFRRRVDRICKPVIILAYGPEYVVGPIKVKRSGNPGTHNPGTKLVYRNPYTNEDEYVIVDKHFNIVEMRIGWTQPANNPLRWSKERLKAAYESGELEKLGVRVE